MAVLIRALPLGSRSRLFVILETPIPTKVNIMNSRAIFKLDIGFYIGTVLIALLHKA